jgi:hypothetical protein
LWIDAAVRGVRVLRGDARVIEPLARHRARDVRSDEIGRLLANRATGLALSRLALEAGADDERAARHLAKGWLALGDALLLLSDRYAPRIAARSADLCVLAASGDATVHAIAAGYARAVAFRKAPSSARISLHAFAAEARAQWQAMARLERHRLGARTPESPWAFAASPSPVFPSLDDVRPLARAVGGMRAALNGYVGWTSAVRHPRETLARASVVLAFDDDRRRAFAWAQRSLGARAPEPLEMAHALERVREIAA